MGKEDEAGVCSRGDGGPSLLGAGQLMAPSDSISSLVLGSPVAPIRSRSLQTPEPFASPHTWVWDLPGGVGGILRPVAMAKPVWELLGKLRSRG